jgi:hypothetical protein
VLVVICVVLGVFGWSLRPQSGGFPTVPEDITLAVTATGLMPITETLIRTAGNGSQLELLGGGPQFPPSTEGGWTLLIDDLGTGRVCTPSTYTYIQAASSSTVLPQFRVTHPFIPSTDPYANPHWTQVASSGPFYVELCWSSGGPVSLGGSYLSAQFPPVSSSPSTVAVTPILNPDGGDTANYTIQSTTAPTGSTPNSWSWSTRASASETIHLSAVNTSGTQHDTYRGFLSGVAFGIAGGALITLIQELVGPLSRRREERHPN